GRRPRAPNHPVKIRPAASPIRSNNGLELARAVKAGLAEEVPTPHLFRRLFHLASPVFLAYYWIPEDLGATGIRKEALLLLAVGTVLVVDVARIALPIPFFGLPTYEAGRAPAYRL